ncbi:MAG: hypothetical protein ACRC0Y_04115 [Fusobacteriaceae bacterium]
MMNSIPKNSENTVIDKIKISLLLFVFFLAFLFSESTQKGEFVLPNSTITDIVDNKLPKIKLSGSDYKFVMNREEKTNNIGE